MIQNQFAVPSKIDVWNTLLEIDFDTTFTYLNKKGEEYAKYSHIEKNKLLYLQNHIDKFHYVIHKITEGKVFAKVNDTQFINLNIDTLRKMLGARYTKEVLSILLDLQFIETDNHYIKGIKSKGYRIAPAFNSKCILRMVFKEEIWNSKILAQKTSYKLSIKNKSFWKNLTQISIHADLATDFIDTKYANTISVLNSYKDNLSSISCYSSVFDSLDNILYSTVSYSLIPIHLAEKALQQTINQHLTPYQLLTNSVINMYNADLMSIQKIAKNDYFLEQPDPLSRIYTNITNLSTDLRQFLFHKKTKQNLINQDIRNSQPYIFSLLLMDMYKDKLIPEDVKHYIKLTAEGNFYEYIMNLLNIPIQKRKVFKIEFFAKIFFCKTHYSKRTSQGKLFNKHFPNVYKLINQYKESGHENLAIQMQRKEASIILTKCCSQLRAKKVWYTTIHDSVVTLAEHQEEVKKLLLATFFEAVGMEPTISLEPLTLA